MFIRRMFYNKETGQILYSYSMQGAFTAKPVEHDLQSTALKGTPSDQISFLEWTQPDPDLEDKIRRTTSMSVVDGALTFADAPLA